MNRRWPLRGCWALLAVTTISAIVSVFTDAPRVITAALAAATGFVWLCQRRYFQHALGGAFVATFALGMAFAPGGPLMEMWPTTLIACGLLAGCRGSAERVLRHRQPPDGLRVLWFASALFGVSMLPFRWWSAENLREGLDWQLAVLPLGGTLIAMLVQGAAAVFLVKTIPEAKQDERPAIALWLVLMGWLLLAPAR